MANKYTFREHGLSVTGTRDELVALAEELRTAEGTLGDLRYQIEYAFDIDGVRSANPEEDPEFEPTPDPEHIAKITKYELIDHLIGIREYSESMVSESELDDVWQKDVEVITEVIALIQKYVP